MQKTFVNSTWPGYQPPIDFATWIILVLVTLVVEIGAVYAWYRTEKKDFTLLVLVVAAGNVFSAIVGYIIVTLAYL